MLSVLKLGREMKICGSIKFAAYTHRDFVLMAPRVPCARTVSHEGT
jgi:hypothetical protein